MADAGSARRIQPLPAETQSQIRSSVHITSLGEVVSGLVKNAIDADATCVTVRLDLRRGSCAVVDNGHGIPHDEFTDARSSHLGRAFCTSRASKPHRQYYGRHGQFLAALANVAVVLITSKDGTRGTSSMVLDGRRSTLR